MKRKDLYSYIREEIIETLSEIDVDKAAGAVVVKKGTPASAPPEIKKYTTQGIDVNVVAEEDIDEARKAGGYKIGDTGKFAEAKELYGAGLYADVLKAIEEAGEDGLTQKDLGAKLGKGDGSSLNFILNKFKAIGVLGGGKLAAAEKPSKAAPEVEPEADEEEDDFFKADDEDTTPEEKPQVTTDKEIKKIAGDIDTGKSSELNKAINVIKNVTDKLQNMKSGSKEYNDKMIALRQYIGKNKNLLRGQDISLLTKKLIGGGEI
jgi:hypothetical protein